MELHSDYIPFIGGDFNVDWSRYSYHTECLSDFVATHNSICMGLNTRFNIDYTFKFSKERFSVSDHFLLLQHTFDMDTDIVHNLFVEHNMDNCSVHDPLFLVLVIHISQTCSTRHVSRHRVNWSMATDRSLFNHCCVLSDRSRAINSPVDALLCTDLFCSHTAHSSSSNEYCNIIGRSCSTLVQILFLHALISKILVYPVGRTILNFKGKIIVLLAYFGWRQIAPVKRSLRLLCVVRGLSITEPSMMILQDVICLRLDK